MEREREEERGREVLISRGYHVAMGVGVLSRGGFSGEQVGRLPSRPVSSSFQWRRAVEKTLKQSRTQATTQNLELQHVLCFLLNCVLLIKTRESRRGTKKKIERYKSTLHMCGVCTGTDTRCSPLDSPARLLLSLYWPLVPKRNARAEQITRVRTCCCCCCGMMETTVPSSRTVQCCHYTTATTYYVVRTIGTATCNNAPAPPPMSLLFTNFLFSTSRPFFRGPCLSLSLSRSRSASQPVPVGNTFYPLALPHNLRAIPHVA